MYSIGNMFIWLIVISRQKFSYLNLTATYYNYNVIIKLYEI